jgi:quercetin dioxygenase-like cupin family protein
MEATIPTPATVLDAADVGRIPQVQLDGLAGVRHRVLWQDANSMAGVLTVEAGHRLGAHTHRRNHHHIWVLQGRADIGGSMLGEGSYAHIPAGVEHDIDATGTDGCTVFYLYILPGT